MGVSVFEVAGARIRARTASASTRASSWSGSGSTPSRSPGSWAGACRAFEIGAPQVVAFEPGHDAWVTGTEAAVLIEFDAESDTVRRFGLPPEHRHGSP